MGYCIALTALLTVLIFLLLTKLSVHFGCIDKFLVSRDSRVIDMFNDTDDSCYKDSDFKPLPLTAENVIKVATKMKEIYDNNHHKYTHIKWNNIKISILSFDILDLDKFNVCMSVAIEKPHQYPYYGRPQCETTPIWFGYSKNMGGECFCSMEDEIGSKSQFVFDMLQDFIINGELHLDNRAHIYELMSKLEVETVDKLNPNLLEYINIDDTYYMRKGNRKYLYRFDDWSTVGANDQPELLQSILTSYTNATCCEDPRKTHWKHFLEIDMKAKRKKQVDCHKFVDEILKKQVEYNDLQVIYEMLPSAPIIDYETFENFCKLVREEVNHDIFEIQNYLLFKRSAK